MGTQSKGKRGEAAAVAALLKAGYEIIARNWRCAIGEIDLIAKHRQDIVFVEVRSRSDSLDAALESINTRKRNRLMQLAQFYLDQHGLEDSPFRIDAVAVAFEPGSRTPKVEIIEDAVGW
ncbi:MAG TPA: YraN family protein [Aggregatilineales bacterium]|nr:YraN family protein [Aggregatilineales bacterium]